MESEAFTLQFEADTSTRLDHFLVAQLTNHSRTRLQQLIKAGEVTVDGIVVTKSSMKLELPCEVEVRIPPPAPSHLIPEDIPLAVLYEDENLLVVDKPAGMVVHPSAGHSSGTLVHAALAHTPDLQGVGGELRPGVVHRLDKDTSGVILLAKNDATHRHLQAQFADRKVVKHYLALVDGMPPTPEGRVEAPIGRDPSQRQRMAVVPESKGRSAASEYRTVERFQDHTLLEFHPITGRTHQIRVHAAFLGCPIVGDTVYGRRTPSLPLQRHFLHAAALSIKLPGQATAANFEAPLPTNLEEILQQLR